MLWTLLLRSTGFSSCITWAQSLGCTGLVAPWHMESSQTRDQTHVLCLPRPGIEPVSPALAGGFLTIVLPGKSCPRPIWEGCWGSMVSIRSCVSAASRHPPWNSCNAESTWQCSAGQRLAGETGEAVWLFCWYVTTAGVWGWSVNNSPLALP